MLMLKFVVPIVAYKAVIWIAAILGVVAGTAMLIHPQGMINFQISAYRVINWKMEPMNLQRELRTTRWMGALAIFCGIGSSLIQLFMPWPQ